MNSWGWTGMVFRGRNIPIESIVGFLRWEKYSIFFVYLGTNTTWRRHVTVPQGLSWPSRREPTPRREDPSPEMYDGGCSTNCRTVLRMICYDACSRGGIGGEAMRGSRQTKVILRNRDRCSTHNQVLFEQITACGTSCDIYIT